MLCGVPTGLATQQWVESGRSVLNPSSENGMQKEPVTHTRQTDSTGGSQAPKHDQSILWAPRGVFGSQFHPSPVFIWEMNNSEVRFVQSKPMSELCPSVVSQVLFGAAEHQNLQIRPVFSRASEREREREREREEREERRERERERE